MAVQFFGQYLLQRGVIDAKQLLAAIEYQESQNLKLGEYAVKKGYISEADAERVNQLQQSKDLRFGEAAVELSLLTDSQVEEIITAQKNDHVYLGDAVVIKEFASREQVDAALKAFKEDQKEYASQKIELPEGVPNPDISAAFFDLTHKLLLRMGGIENKLGHGQVKSGSVQLPEMSVQVSFTGQINTKYIVGMSGAVARKMAKKVINADSPSEEELDDVVREFANVVCGNIVARMAQAGKQSDISPPQSLASDLDLAGQKAALIPLATPDGEVAVLLTF